ncbi:MAG TPA: AAA family ATPase [Tepidisphaeraceae bacterium]|jgi:energy-coupling factor transporter ATP-binding protein EcfA2|nr:AAA family ATPase [Tepidisphaeraceae bacterium]
MVTKISIQSFKSIENLELQLGRLNVFVGANGSGKSNILEGLGVLSAAADGKVNDQTLLQRGVRPGVPKLYKSAFPAKNGMAPSHIWFSATSDKSHYDVSLNNPLNDPHPAWLYKHELWERGNEKLASRGPNMNNPPNKEAGLAALKAVELEPNDSALLLLRRLQGYVIYSPTTPVLRGIAPETQPRNPLGLSGGRLPEAVDELLHRLHGKHGDKNVSVVLSDVLPLIGWAKKFAVGSASELPLSPAVSATRQVIAFEDRFMAAGRNVLSGYDASEGALYVLFLAVLAAHPQAPSMMAIDNADHGLNPELATRLMKAFADWILTDKKCERQILITSHNPAVLDGLPLQNDAVRLFTVDRDNVGRTVVKRVVVDEKMLEMAKKGWTLSRLWTNKLIGGMPDV